LVNTFVDPEEALHQRGEFGRSHPRGKPRRAAHVGIQHRNLDLGAAAFLCQHRLALLAEMRIAPPWPEPHPAQRRRGEPVEADAAQPAAFAGGRRDQTHHLAPAPQRRMLPGEHLLPEQVGIPVVGGIRHVNLPRREIA
jgi:hypothetical protein